MGFVEWVLGGIIGSTGKNLLERRKTKGNCGWQTPKK